MEVDEHHFDGYKQCGPCRAKAVYRKRKSVTCECGRTLLACSLKVHLRSLYHAEHVKLRQPPHVALAARTSVATARKQQPTKIKDAQALALQPAKKLEARPAPKSSQPTAVARSQYLTMNK